MTTQAPGPRLVFRNGEFAGTSVELGSQITLGRGADNDVVLKSALLSQRHARIYLEGGEYYLEDLGSLNGTTLDRVPVRGRARLERLHVISLGGEIDLVFVPGAPAVQGSGQTDPAHGATPPAAARDTAAPAVEGHTRVDMIGFGALPQIERRRRRRAAEPISPGPAVRPERLPSQPEIRPPVFHLEVLPPGEAARTFPLKEGDNTIGRSDESNIVVPDPDKHLSRVHATLHVVADSVTLIDLESVNGTFVDGQKIVIMRLEPGASFQLGPFLKCKLHQQ